MGRFTFFLSFLFSYGLTLAQENPILSTNLIQSRTFFHTPKIHLVKAPYTQSVEITYSKHTRGKAYWQERFGYPEPSLSLLIVNNGEAALGYTIGVYPSIQFRMVGGRKAFWYGRFGGGIGWVTRHWSRQDTLNNIIGGRVNNVSMFQTGFRYLLGKKWSIQTGLCFYHASNASARQPNFGLNNYGCFVGLNFHPNGVPKEYIHTPKDEKKQRTFGMKASFAMAEDKMPDGPMYSYYNWTIFIQKNIRGKYHLFGGTDFTYNSRYYALFKNNFQYPGKERLKSFRNTVFVGYEFLFGKVGFPLQLGLYSSRPLGGPLIYQKLGIQWYMVNRPESTIKRVFLFTQLKTHLVQAEFAEFGLGINI